MTQDTTPATDLQDLTLAARTILGNSIAELTLRDGKTLQVRPAKMKHLKVIVEMFTRIGESIDPESLGALVQGIAGEQKQRLAEGKDPLSINVNEVESIARARKAFGDVGILKTVFIAILDELPGLAAMFSNLTEDEFDELDTDEGILVMGSIVTLNYGFFIQSWPLLLTAFTKLLAREPKAPQSDVSTKPVSGRGQPIRRRPL